MALFSSKAGVRQMAVSSCAATWGKVGFGVSQLVFAAPDAWLVLASAGLGAVFAACIAVRVVRTAPEKALVIAILAIPLPARLNAPLRAWLIGGALGAALLGSLALCLGGWSSGGHHPAPPRAA